ncbi:MAG: hypothetical protein H7338_22320 [Candidatus Sericytochromatia bacterium]|nr:hypothetical protein [Candidatus Sericytochromatia bacterium]
MAATPPETARQSTSPTRWTDQLLVAITPAGLAAARDLDLRTSMYEVLRLGTTPRTWGQATAHLATLYGRHEQECSRLLIVAETSGWLSIGLSRDGHPMRLADFLQRTGLLGEARTAALARRLPPGPKVDVPALSSQLAAVGWLGRAEAGFLARIGRQAIWHWQ